MHYRLIDPDHWDRKPYYDHYTKALICTYSMTVELDITALRGHQLYPAMLWLLTDTVNEYEEFRTRLFPDGLGVLDSMSPRYTVFNEEKESFSILWTQFSPDYPTFLARYRRDAETYRNPVGFTPKAGMPNNCFDISMIPWASFTAFSLNVHNAPDYLLPVFTMGRFTDRNGRRYLPLACQVHHAVCDGFHLSRFVNTLQKKIDAFPPLEQC